MKLKPLVLLLFIIVFSSVAFSQSVTITSKKVTFNRAKPLADYKKSFTVNYPKVKAATPAVSKKIEKSISYETVLGVNVEEEKNEIQWLETADFEVAYNKNGLLCMLLFAEGSAAYPSTNVKTVVVNTKIGTIIKPVDAFTNLKSLAVKLKKMQTSEIAAAKKEIIADKENYGDVNADEMFDNTDFTVENIDEFAIDDKGVTFKYDYGFPHVSQALQPSGNYSMTWAELKPYVKKTGVFAKFAK